MPREAALATEAKRARLPRNFILNKCARRLGGTKQDWLEDDLEVDGLKILGRRGGDRLYTPTIDAFDSDAPTIDWRYLTPRRGPASIRKVSAY